MILKVRIMIFILEDVEDIEHDNLTKSEGTFLSEVHEKLDWVDENPDDESRQVGWIDIEQFLSWLSNRCTRFGVGDSYYNLPESLR